MRTSCKTVFSKRDMGLTKLRNSLDGKAVIIRLRILCFLVPVFRRSRKFFSFAQYLVVMLV